MSQLKGRCTNVGNCGAADNSLEVQIDNPQDPVCPICGGALTVLEERRPVIPLRLITIVAPTLIVLAAAIIYLIWPHRPISVPQPVPILRLHGSNTIGSE